MRRSTTERAKPWAGVRPRFAAAVGAVRRPGDPAAPGRSVRRGCASSTRTLRCSQRAGEGRTRGPPAAVRFAKPSAWRTPRMGGSLLRRLPMLGARTAALDPIALRRSGNPPAAALLAAAEARSRTPAHGFASNARGVCRHLPLVVRQSRSRAAGAAPLRRRGAQRPGGCPIAVRRWGRAPSVRGPTASGLRSKTLAARGVRQDRAAGFADRSSRRLGREFGARLRGASTAAPVWTSQPPRGGSLASRAGPAQPGRSVDTKWRPPQRSGARRPAAALHARSMHMASPGRCSGHCEGTLRVSKGR